MEIDKPLISILMAVYEPNLDWFREQLLSLEAQTYPHLRLFICDDCSPTVSFETIQSYVRESVRSIPYTIQRNEKNLGSNLTFERLTREADGDYFAYCDQDDVWMPEKLAQLASWMEDPSVQLICSDVRIIDGSGRKTADSITQVRRRHRFLSGGAEVFRRLLTRNFVIGCTMLVRRETALAAVPFEEEMVHDHWIALVAASRGNVISLPQPLIDYRIHGGNQTGVLTGISNRQEYIDTRIVSFEKRLKHIWERFPERSDTEAVLQWAKARTGYAAQWCPSSAARLWRLRSENRVTTLFELLMLWAPEPLFRQALRVARGVG